MAAAPPSSKLRIIVTGLVATYPLGGVFWDYVQYLTGFHDLGHDVIYVEDTGQWCFDHVQKTMVKSGKRSARWLANQLNRVAPDLSDRWFFRDAAGDTYGLSWDYVKEFARTADLFLNISATSLLRDEYITRPRAVFVDTDPLYTQASVPEFLDGTADVDARNRIESMLRHDVFFTFGENVGASDCLIPTGLFDWIPTRQPVSALRLGSFGTPISRRRRRLTTVGSWEPSKKALMVKGKQFYGKSAELLRFLELPLHSSIGVEMALAGDVPSDKFERYGWVLASPSAVSRTAASYIQYLSSSFAEWSVAKNAYVASRSGWFSCRSACYLALGVPVIAQDTGFSKFLPTGEGLFAYSSVDETVAAIDAITSDYKRHCERSREIAVEFLDSSSVLDRLLHDALSESQCSAPVERNRH
jgi:hypothetical protein